MARHTTFRFCLDPTVEQSVVLVRHVGAARFAYNQCLRLHLDARQRDRARGGRGAGDIEQPRDAVPWSRFSLINAFNQWKRSEAAGRRFFVASDRIAQVEVTGLAWRGEVSAEVLEEGAVDVGRGLAAWTEYRSGKRKGRPVGHPRFKKKNDTAGSFRMRNRTQGNRSSIRVGQDGPRSVTLPTIGSIHVREDTRRLRRMIANGRGRILQATITRGARRWWISVTVEAADLHPAVRHSPRNGGEETGWVGVDRGLHALAVAGTSDGTETLRVQAPRTLATGLRRQRRLARAVSRKKRGSAGWRTATGRLAKHHVQVRDTRQHFLHQVSNQLVKTHDRLVLEDLNITGIMSNRKLARVVGDAAWGELARQITYKQRWRHGQVVVADRWFPSSKTCSGCGMLRRDLTLRDRAYTCDHCGLVLDRDLNAAANLAAWAQDHTRGEAQDGDRQAAGPDINACRRDGSDPRARG